MCASGTFHPYSYSHHTPISVRVRVESTPPCVRTREKHIKHILIAQRVTAPVSQAPGIPLFPRSNSLWGSRNVSRNFNNFHLNSSPSSSSSSSSHQRHVVVVKTKSSKYRKNTKNKYWPVCNQKPAGYIESKRRNSTKLKPHFQNTQTPYSQDY